MANKSDVNTCHLFVSIYSAMLRPMIENMQREMNATGAQPFAIPFNDPSLAAASVPSSRLAANPPAMQLSRRFKVSGKPKLHLSNIAARIRALNDETQVLTDVETGLLVKFASQVTDDIDLSATADKSPLSEDSLQLWQALLKLLSQGQQSSFFFPALGVFRVLLLLPVKTSGILVLKNECFDLLLQVTESSDLQLSDAQTIVLLSVLVNGFANPVASELVLSRSVRFLPFAFSAISDSSHQQVRVLGATLISNCCLALKIEEEVVITTVICGAVETLDRISREQHQSASQQQTIEGVIGGVASLLRNFAAARSLSSELGLPDVLRRLHASASLGNMQPLLSEVVALI